MLNPDAPVWTKAMDLSELESCRQGCGEARRQTDPFDKIWREDLCLQQSLPA